MVLGYMVERERSLYQGGHDRKGRGTGTRVVMVKERNGTSSVMVEKERNWYQGYHGRERGELVPGVSW